MSPVKRRKPPPRDDRCKVKASTPDAEVWETPDDEIIGILSHSAVSVVLTIRVAASVKTWKSSVYDHYKTSVARIEANDKRYIDFIFTCKFGVPSHGSQRRRRMGSRDGTGNLRKAMLKCPKHTQAQLVAGSHSEANSTSYSPAAHRVLIALRCATSKWSFNSVSDPLYANEVQMLRPGTKLPSPSTVSCDVTILYEKGSSMVKQYFLVGPDVWSNSTTDLLA